MLKFLVYQRSQVIVDANGIIEGIGGENKIPVGIGTLCKFSSVT